MSVGAGLFSVSHMPNINRALGVLFSVVFAVFGLVCMTLAACGCVAVLKENPSKLTPVSASIHSRRLF